MSLKIYKPWIFLALLLGGGISPGLRADEGALGQSPRDLTSLSSEEREIYDRGLISQGRYVAGGVVGSLVGFGVGHAIVGEYQSLGWAFTVGEAVGLAALSAGITTLSSCLFVFCSDERSARADAWITFGTVIYYGFRIWEIVDIWVRPQRHNQRYHQIRQRVESTQILPFVDTQGRPSLGLQYRF